MKLKPKKQCIEDECHAFLCHKQSDIILADKAAMPLDRDWVELCDKHHEQHIKEMTP